MGIHKLAHFNRRGTVEPAPFHPLNVAGMSRWWDASDAFVVQDRKVRQCTKANNERFYISSSAADQIAIGGTNNMFWFGGWCQADTYTTPSQSFDLMQQYEPSGTQRIWRAYIGTSTSSGNFRKFSFSVSSNGDTRDAAYTYEVPENVPTFCGGVYDGTAGIISATIGDTRNRTLNTIVTQAFSGGVHTATPAMHIGGYQRDNGRTFPGKLWGMMIGKISGQPFTAAGHLERMWNGGTCVSLRQILAEDWVTNYGLTEYVPLNETSANDGYGKVLTWTGDNTPTFASADDSQKRTQDYSGNDNHGYLLGYTVSDVVGTGLQKDNPLQSVCLKGSSADSITCGDIDDAALSGTAGFSVSARVKFDSTISGTILSKNSGSDSQRQWEMFISTGKLGFKYHGDGAGTTYYGRQTTTTLNTGQWYTVGATVDMSQGTEADRIKLFVDGVEFATEVQSTSGSPSTINDGTAPVSLGGQANVAEDGAVAGMSGDYYDFRLYNTNLSSSDHASVHADTMGTTNLIGHWCYRDYHLPFWMGAGEGGQMGILVNSAVQGASSLTTNMVQSTASIQPRFTTVSGSQGLDFGTANSRMVSTASGAYTDVTCFVVMAPSSSITSATPKQILLGSGSAGTASVAQGQIALGSSTSGITNEALSFLAWNGSVERGVGTTTSLSAVKQILQFKLDGTTETIYINNNLETVSESTNGSMDSSAAGSRWDKINRIGQDWLTSSQYEGDIFDIIIYDSALSDSDCSKVRTFLADKHGITL